MNSTKITKLGANSILYPRRLATINKLFPVNKCCIDIDISTLQLCAQAKLQY